MAQDIIKDPVTGQQFSRDPSIAGSTYAPYIAPVTTDSVQTGINKLSGDIKMYADQLGNQATPITVPPPPPSTTNTKSNALVAGAEAYMEAQKALQTPEDKTRNDRIDQLINSAEASMGELQGRGAYTIEQKNLYGATPEAKAAITELDSKIASETAKFKKVEEEFMKASLAEENIPGSTSRITSGYQAQLAKNLAVIKVGHAADIGLLQAEQMRLTGKYNDAITAANEAVTLKYADKKDEIDYKLKQIELIQGQLDKKEKARAEALTYALTQQKAELDDAEALDKSIQTIATKVAENGAPNSVRSAVLNSKTYEEALRNAGSFMQTAKERGGDGITGQLSSLTNAIIDNPSLFDDLTPTNKGVVIKELQTNGYDTSNLGVKGLSDTAIKEVAQTQKALSDLSDLKALIEGKSEMLGPITGLARFNPWSEARKLQADVDRVRQTVGKALEGGVLRKEDEEKYKKILATLSDTPSTAIYKIDALLSSIQRDIENYKSLQQSSGKSLDVGASLQKKGGVPTSEELRNKYNY